MHHWCTLRRPPGNWPRSDPSSGPGSSKRLWTQGKPVTAAEIKRHLPPPPMQPSGAQGTARPTLPPPPPSQVLDATGWPIPTQLIPLWQRADEVQEMLTALSRVKGALRTAQENRDMLFAEVNFSSALSQLDQAWTDIKTAKPFAVCPTLPGPGSGQVHAVPGAGADLRASLEHLRDAGGQGVPGQGERQTLKAEMQMNADNA